MQARERNAKINMSPHQVVTSDIPQAVLQECVRSFLDIKRSTGLD